MRILAYALSDALAVDFVLETVNRLIEKHGASLDAETLVHSDRDSHYTSKRFRGILSDSNLRQSMSRKGNCWDNAPQESFFGHMKDEIADKIAACSSFEEAGAVIDDYMDYYNDDHGQWQLDKLTPNEYYDYCRTGVYPLPLAPCLHPQNRFRLSRASILALDLCPRLGVHLK